MDLRIFVDKGSVEVIPNHGEIYGAMLVFPNYAGIGMEAYSTGGDTAPETADQAVEWILDDPDQTVAVAAQDDISITLRAEAAGDFSLTAAAKGGSVTKTVPSIPGKIPSGPI